MTGRVASALSWEVVEAAALLVSLGVMGVAASVASIVIGLIVGPLALATWMIVGVVRLTARVVRGRR